MYTVLYIVYTGYPKLFGVLNFGVLEAPSNLGIPVYVWTNWEDLQREGGETLHCDPQPLVRGPWEGVWEAREGRRRDKIRTGGLGRLRGRGASHAPLSLASDWSVFVVTFIRDIPIVPFFPLFLRLFSFLRPILPITSKKYHFSLSRARRGVGFLGISSSLLCDAFFSAFTCCWLPPPRISDRDPDTRGLGTGTTA